MSLKNEMEKIKQSQCEMEAERKAISETQDQINFYKREMKKMREETLVFKTKRQALQEKYNELQMSLASKKNELDFYVAAIEQNKRTIQEEQKKLDDTHYSVWKKRDMICESIFNFTERYRPSQIKKLTEYQDLGQINPQDILDVWNEKLFQSTLVYEELQSKIKQLSNEIEQVENLKK